MPGRKSSSRETTSRRSASCGHLPGRRSSAGRLRLAKSIGGPSDSAKSAQHLIQVAPSGSAPASKPAVFLMLTRCTFGLVADLHSLTQIPFTYIQSFPPYTQALINSRTQKTICRHYDYYRKKFYNSDNRFSFTVVTKHNCFLVNFIEEPKQSLQ